MQTTQQPEAPAPGVRFTARAEEEPTSMEHHQVLQQMSLEKLLYYVLVRDGRRAAAKPG